MEPDKETLKERGSGGRLKEQIVEEGGKGSMDYLKR